MFDSDKTKEQLISELAEIREKKIFLENILDNILDPIVITDVEGSITRSPFYKCLIMKKKSF